MNMKNKIQVSLGVLVIFAVLFSIVPAEASTTLNQVTVIAVPGDIYVNGEFAAHNYGYYRNLFLPVGQYTIKVTRDHYIPKSVTVTVNDKSSIYTTYVGALTYIK
jgi:hypothetical protein